LNIVFAGTPEFTLPSLEALALSSHQLLAIYTQPDRPEGRGQKLKASSVKNWAMARKIAIYQPINFKEEAALAQLAALRPDVIVVIAYGLILPPQVLAIPKFGCVNVHASLLPRWRGASPIQHALLHGDKETGITIMQMDTGMDSGPKLAEVSCPIFPEDTAGHLHERLAQLAVEPLLDTLAAIERGVIRGRPQDDTQATYAGKINKADAKINWHKTAEEIHNQIRAFNPWPIAYTAVGSEILRIYQAYVEDISFAAAPGTVLALNKEGILVATGKKALRIETIQFPGGKVMSVADWLNAKRSNLQVNVVMQ
jgi:methionyl-tRNA formyltransferase